MNENNLESSQTLLSTIEKNIELFKSDPQSIHPYDLSVQLLKLRTLNPNDYINVVKKIPSDLFANVMAELPTYVQEEVSNYVSINKLATITSKMDTDDASTLLQNIGENNEEVVQTILEKFSPQDKKILEQLIAYEDNVAGSYMQTELFSARNDEPIGQAIKRLKEKKESGKLGSIWFCQIIDKNGVFLGSVGLEELITFEHHLTFQDIPSEKIQNYCVNHTDNINNVVEMVTNYNLTSVPVVNESNKLIGRITSDDILHIIQKNATEQIYNMAGVKKEEQEIESIYKIGKSRAFWLSINLMTAIMASIIIGIFDETIQSLVALAVLMPIVASMGGNAGTQTLTVTVRQMALGNISPDDAKNIVYKEVIIALVNGLVFAFTIGVIAYFWFNLPLLGVVIAASMIINLLSAGFFGTIIPLGLQKLNIDPAVGSTVILTTVTDVVGFFSFLGLATIVLK